MSDTEEYRLKIDAYTPETIPMERLAQYLAELAQMLGEPTAVHFVRLEAASTSVIHRIQREALPKVKARTAAVRRGIGPRDAVRAYRKINKMLREDNGTGVWKEERTSVEILVFPGKDDADEVVRGISQRGSVDGEVVRIGGPRNAVPILLRCGEEEVSGFWANRAVAKALACRLFEPVRLFGTGSWDRNDEGTWKLDTFRVESFVPLRETSLSEALNELRAIRVAWPSDVLLEMSAIRQDQEGPRNGGV